MQLLQTHDLFNILSEIADPSKVEYYRKTKEEYEQTILKAQELQRTVDLERRENNAILEDIRKARAEGLLYEVEMKKAFELREASNEQRELQLKSKAEALQNKEVQLNHREAQLAQRENSIGQREHQLMSISGQVSERQLKVNKVTEDLREYLCQLT